MSATTAVEMPEIGATGLTPKEVVQRIESGQSNAVKTSTSRSVQDIVRANVFTLFNGIIFAAMVLVLITGSWRDAVFGFVIIINTGIGIVTELRAKRTLDRLSILVASEFLVHRDGRDVEVPHNEIVLDDLLWIRAGEQVPADGQIIQTWGLELDESMLTGESRTVRHKVGEQVYSGATAVSGMALVKVNAVGSHSYAATLTAQAKVYKKTVSDLNKGINTILKFMTFLVVPLCILLILSQIHTVGGWGTALSTGEWRQAVVSAVAGVVGMIPEGLVLLTSLNFAVAAMRLARHNTLVQELESVETLARVDALNLDKTGTITDGGIAFNRLVMLDSANAAAEQAATQALYDCCNEEQPNGTGGKNSLDLAANYEIGKLGLGAGYSKLGDKNQFAVRASYSTGPFVLGAYVQRDKNVFFSGNRTNLRLSAAYIMGVSEFHVNVGRAGNYSNAPDTAATQYTLGYNYNLSKRTKVYTYYTRVNNSQAAKYGDVSAPGNDFSSFAVGVRHNF